MPGHLVMEWLRQGPQQQSYQRIKSIFNPSAPSLEARLASRLCSQYHTGIGKPVQLVTSGNHVPAPWTIKGQDQRPLAIHRQGQAGNQQIIVHQCGLVSQPTSVQARSSKLPRH